jgi:predicted transcriptional regulator
MTVKTLPVQEAFVLVEKLDLPPEYTWFNELNAEERSEFFRGLLEILTVRSEELTSPDGRPRTRMAALDEYIRGWQATVEIESSPELLEAIQRGLDDAKHGRFVSQEEVEEFLRDV